MIKMKGYDTKQVKSDYSGAFGENPLATRENINNLTSNKDAMVTQKRKLGVSDFITMMRKVKPAQGASNV
jgi:hypothetical protein